MKPCSELNPRVWQGDCFMGIDQKRSEMFQSWKAGGPLLGTDSVHYPDDIAARRLPPNPRFAAEASQVISSRPIALTNEDAEKLFLTAKRFSSLGWDTVGVLTVLGPISTNSVRFRAAWGATLSADIVLNPPRRAPSLRTSLRGRHDLGTYSSGRAPLPWRRHPNGSRD